MKFILSLLLGLCIISCDKKKEANETTNIITQKAESTSVIPAFSPTISIPDQLAGDTCNIELTLDKEENIRRIQNSSGYANLSHAQKEQLNRVILSALYCRIYDVSFN